MVLLVDRAGRFTRFYALEKEMIRCSFCNKLIELGNNFICRIMYSKKSKETLYSCISCLDNLKRLESKQYFTMVVSVIKEPLKKTLVFDDRYIPLQNGNISALDDSGCITKDNTKLAGRNIPEVELPDMTKRIKELDKPIIKDSKVLDYLDELKESKLIIPEKSKYIKFGEQQPELNEEEKLEQQKIREQIESKKTEKIDYDKDKND